MKRMLIHKTNFKSVVVVSVLLLSQTSLVWASDDVTGVWEIMMEFNGRKSFAMVNISKNEDGTLAGTWGDRDLSDVKFQDGKLTFNRTVGPPDRESTINYEGTLKDGKLMLTSSSDWGEFSAVGARPKPKCPILGQWDINFTVFDRDIHARLIISQKPDGSLMGEWTEEEGEHKISDVKFKDGKLTFTRESKLDEFQFETYYEGVLKGHDLTGMFKNEMGQWQTTGKRVGAELVGEWELTIVSDWGTHEGMMKIFGDLTGRYGFFDSELPMKNIKLEGDQVIFKLEMGWGDQTFDLDFKGKLDGAKLEGQLMSDRGTSDITGKKVEKKAPAPAAPAMSVIGKWELTTTSERGTRTRVLTINKDMTGMYQVRDGEVPVQDLKYENGQLTFKIERSFDDRQFVMDFKGKVQGDTIEGEFTTGRGTRSVTGKKMAAD